MYKLILKRFYEFFRIIWGKYKLNNFVLNESKENGAIGVKYVGRFDFDDEKGPKFAWSGSTISARFYGTEVSVKLWSTGDYFTVLLDGKIITNSLYVKGENTFVLAEGLDEGIHEVCLAKRTEFNIGTSKFQGFSFNGGKLLSPLPHSNRKIEFIGDSITCGYGVEGENESILYDPKYDNAYLAYGPQVARALNADAMLISCSGYGLIRAYSGSNTQVMPNMYSKVTPSSTKKWDFKSWVPDVVSINLGTNDFSNNFLPDRKEFVNAYINFIKTIFKNYLNAAVICCVGPMMEMKDVAVIKDYLLNSIIPELKNQGYCNIHFIEIEHQKKENGYGVACHPSLRTHKLMAEQLAEEIKKIMKW